MEEEALGDEKKVSRTLDCLISARCEGDQAARVFSFLMSKCVTPVTKSDVTSGFYA